MNYVDLHVHSTASDGTLTPSEVVNLAVKSNLKAIALTDHDTIDGVSEAIEQALQHKSLGKDIELIPGIELSVVYKKKDVHILGLFIDYKNIDFKNKLVEIRSRRDGRNEKMAQNLVNAGIDISYEELKKFAGDAVLTRAHFAKLLINKGYVKTMAQAFEKYLGDHTPYFVGREHLSPKEGISLIHEAGGVAILAHPFIYKYTLSEVETLIDDLVPFGLDGVEIIHSSNTGFDEGHIRRLTNKHNLQYSGGSDFHGDNKPNLNIGIGYGNVKVKEEILNDLKKYIKNKEVI